MATASGPATWAPHANQPEYDGLTDGGSVMDESPDGEPIYAHWCNAVGQRAIRQASLLVGGHAADTLFPEAMYAWEQLAGKPGKSLGEMVGERQTRSQLIRDSRQARRLYVPLPFANLLHPGYSIPIVNIEHWGVTIKLGFAELQDLICVSHGDVQVLNAKTGHAVTKEDLSIVIDTCNVFLDKDERKKFSSANFDQLWVQWQAQMGGATTAAPPWTSPSASPTP